MNRSHAIRIGDISTRWSCVADVNRFTLRYAPAMLTYLEAILRDSDVARDVLQDFLVKILERGFADREGKAGRFRDYLTVAVRNSALSYFRSRRSTSLAPELLDSLASPSENDERWKQSWTECLLQRAWRALEDYQEKTSGNRYFAILRLSTDQPSLSSQEAAAILAEKGMPLSADAFRQQLRRARIQFAQFLVQEVQETLDVQTRSEVVDELRSLGLMPYVRPFLER
ncbi:MAG: sigma factor [Planctomycetota bacterium]